MKTNTQANRPGAPNFHGVKGPALNPVQELQRSIAACFLWEDGFYEDGTAVAQRVHDLVQKIPDTDLLSRLAIACRTQWNLRHAPLWLAVAMAESPKHRIALSGLLPEIIRRPDELPEFLSLYWKNGKRPLAAQIKKGLARAFGRFNEYSLAKYNRADAPIKLRDVLFLCHAKPVDDAQAALWKRLIDGELATPDTWETAISAAGPDPAAKSAAWTRLLAENKLGALALLRNLRNLNAAGVKGELVADALKRADVSKVLPFRFLAAARNSNWPMLEPDLEAAMLASAQALPKLAGTTVLLIDVSPSMDWSKVSEKSDMTRRDAAEALAMIARETCERVRIFAFSSRIAEVPARRGFALSEAIRSAVEHNGTLLGGAVNYVNRLPDIDRLVVITDEESQDPVPGPAAKEGIMINVATTRHMVGWGPWTRIAGFSENVFRFLATDPAALQP